MPQDERRTVEAQILALAWPAAAQGLLFTIVFFVDGLMVSRLGSASLAAVGAAGPVIWGIRSILFAVFAGTRALVANRTGAADFPGARLVAGQSLLLAFGAGLVVAGPLWLGSAVVLVPFGLAPDVAPQAASYLAITGAALLVALPGLTMVCIFQAAGDTRTPLAVTAVGNVVNILANYVLIFGHFGFPALGVTGAALGTALCRATEFALLACLLPRTPACPTRADLFGLRPDVLGRVLRVGLPAVAETALYQGGYQAFSVMVARLGTTALASHRLCLSIEMLAIMPAEGLSVATATLTGQSLGGGRPDLADYGIARIRVRTAQLMTAVALLFLAVPGLLVRAFAPQADVFTLSVLVVRISALELLPLGITFNLCGAMRGAGDTRSPLFIAFAGIWLVRLPLTYLSAHVLGWGLAGVWVVTALDWASRWLLAERALARGRWKAALPPGGR